MSAEQPMNVQDTLEFLRFMNELKVKFLFSQFGGFEFNIFLLIEFLSNAAHSRCNLFFFSISSDKAGC
jgi:hypothetical protein